jgi:membrane-associated phospholipid phosphatase
MGHGATCGTFFYSIPHAPRCLKRISPFDFIFFRYNARMLQEFIPNFWLGLHSKPLTGILIALIVVLELWRGYFKGFKGYCRSFSIKPYLFVLVLIPILVLLLLPFDYTILRFVQSLNETPVRYFYYFGSQMGDDIWIYIFAVYFLFLAFKRESTPAVFGAILGVALTGLLATILKMILMRARPMMEMGPFSFFNLDAILKDEGHFQSFPSGDVAIVAGAATYFFFALKNPVRYLIFLIPISTAFARVSLHRHWPSDVLTSIILSIIVARFLTDFADSRKTICSTKPHEV